MPRPNFGHLWPRPWPYKPHEGVGLLFRGTPSDPVLVAYVLQSYSCPNPMAYAIAWDLKEKGERKTTVKNIINFVELSERLAPLGITLEIIGPA